jgi:hypothetical protein
LAESLVTPEAEMPTTVWDLDDVNLSLSQEIVREIGQWNLQPILVAAERLIASAPTPAQLDQARGLARRAAEFASLQRRHQEVVSQTRQLLAAGQAPATPGGSATAIPTAAAEAPLAGSREEVVGTSRSAANLAPAVRYDGQGWLIPVYTSRTDLPRYALTDEQGTIVHFVAPAPGLNLRRYLRKRVGVLGTLQSTATDQPGRLVARRVVQLDRHRR